MQLLLVMSSTASWGESIANLFNSSNINILRVAVATAAKLGPLAIKVSCGLVREVDERFITNLVLVLSVVAVLDQAVVVVVVDESMCFLLLVVGVAVMEEVSIWLLQFGRPLEMPYLYLLKCQKCHCYTCIIFVFQLTCLIWPFVLI